MQADLTDDAGIASAVIIGTGRVGSAFARALPRVGISVEAAVTRDADAARQRVGAGLNLCASIVDAPKADLLILAVPDDLIQSAASEMAHELDEGRFRFVIHTSGFHSSSHLASLARMGLSTASFHPIVAFPPPASAVDPFAGAVVAVEGSWEGADALAVRLGARPVRVSEVQKRVIHTAASIAANFSTTLASEAEQLLNDVGLERSTSRMILEPLLASTLRNLGLAPPGEALTGPIVRGDIATIEAHLQVLSESAAELLPLYRVMGMATARGAATAGRLPADVALRVLDVLREADHTP